MIRVRYALVAVTVVLSIVTPAFAHAESTPVDDATRAEIGRLMTEAKRLSAARTTASIDSSIQLYETALEMVEATLGAYDTTAARILVRMAVCEYWRENHDILKQQIDSASAIWSAALGMDHPMIGVGLRVLGDSYNHLGEYTNAEETYRRAATLLEPVKDLEQYYALTLALVYHGLGDVYKNTARLEEALELDFRVKEIRTQALGSDSYLARKANAPIGATLMRMERYAAAEPYLLEALDAQQKELGPDHMLIATTLNRLAQVNHGMGKDDTAKALLARAIPIMENALGPTHAQLAPLLGLQALLLAADGNIAEAQAYARRALSIRRNNYGDAHPFVVFDYRRLARILAASAINVTESYATLTDDEIREAAARLLDEGTRQLDAKTSESLDSADIALHAAIDLIEERFGPSDTTIARALCRLGFVYFWQQRKEDCRRVTDSAIVIWRQELGPDSPEIARGLRLLGDSFIQRGEYTQAQSYFEQTVALLNKQPQLDTLSAHVLALAYFGLANVYLSTNRPEEGLLHSKRMVAVWDEHQMYSPRMRHLEVQLGRSYYMLGQYREATEVLLNVLKLREEVFGPNHTYVALVCTKLAAAYWQLDILDSARIHNERALEILESRLGPEHVMTAGTLALESALFAAEGDYDRAIAVGERGARNRASGRGHNHPYAGLDYARLARLQAASGAIDKALDMYDTLMDSRYKFYDAVFHSSSEAQKLAYSRTANLISPSLFTLALETRSGRARNMVAECILNGKAFVLDVVAVERQEAYCSADAAVHRLLDQYSGVCTRIATISLGSPQSSAGGRDLDSLYKEKEQYEAELSRLCHDFAESLADRRVDAASVASALKNGEVLWEFMRYRPLDFAKVGRTDKWKAPHYLALVIDQTGVVACEDLGKAAEIDSLVERVRSHMAAASLDLLMESEPAVSGRLAEDTRELYQRLVLPLLKRKDATRHVILSPYGSLNLLPFEILVSPIGEYLIEEVAVSYISSGRDLVRYQETPAVPGNEAIILANPDYDALAAEPPQAMTLRGAIGSVSLTTRGPEDYVGCLDQVFDPLHGTMREADIVSAHILKDSSLQLRCYTADSASETLLWNLREPPRILHLATHGYFCPHGTPAESQGNTNPLLYSGLVCAGVNNTIVRRQGNGKKSGVIDDGILTALEVSAMDLRGTEVVVLSACHTGLGVIHGGEGVFGLRRALHLAGARSVIMSLVAVPDDATVELMDLFYGNFLSGMSKSTALRNAELSIIRERRRLHGAAHPLFWGGFVLTGDPQ